MYEKKKKPERSASIPLEFWTKMLERMTRIKSKLLRSIWVYKNFQC